MLLIMSGLLGTALLVCPPPGASRLGGARSIAMREAEEPPVPPPPVGGFYSPYGTDELAKLWEVHTEFFGERDEAAEEESGEVNEGNILGGLHAAVLRTIAEAEAEASDADDDDDSAAGAS